jgi:hypothetical protein
MAKALITVESLVNEFLITGLEKLEDGKAQAAFIQFCKSEYGAIAGDNTDLFAGIKISGKRGKEKGKLNRGSVEFKGGHNVAICALSAASLVYDLEESTGRLIGKMDVSKICLAWWQGKSVKNPASGKPIQQAALIPTPTPAEPECKNGEPTDDGTIIVGADEANNIEE